MSDVKSDIQIAREAKMQPINDILSKINVPDESSAFSPMGRHIAKINLEYLDTLKNKPDGHLCLSSDRGQPGERDPIFLWFYNRLFLSELGQIATTNQHAKEV